ncbi:RNA polymerase sigma factor, partial [Streptomyces lasiicapitis]|uniref:RNA polymerase sigma factor n=1 Tax=Streptomyces lasiicapitis TaxID=1923961 RepID=UPI00368D7EFD
MGAGGDRQGGDEGREDHRRGLPGTGDREGPDAGGREGPDAGGRQGRSRIGDAALTRALADAGQGDEAAFALVYQWVHPGLLGYVRGIVGDESEDVASEAWLQIARDLERFSGDGADFRRWAAAIARNRARDHIRRRMSRPRLSLTDGDALDVPDARDTAEEVLEALATDDTVDLVAALPPDQGKAVFLGVLVGMDSPSAARVLGKRPGAVRMALHRGLRRLRAQLSGTAERRERREHREEGGGPDPGRRHCRNSGGGRPGRGGPRRGAGGAGGARGP